MLIPKINIVLSLLILLLTSIAHSQSSTSFDLKAYKQFLDAHQNMDADQLRLIHPAGSFAKEARTNFSTAFYSDSIQKKYTLTSYEQSLIETNGFMVTERLKRESFGAAFSEIFHNDLPVFVSTDAILHAIHMSYDAILKDVEERILIAKLDSLLAKLHTQLPALAVRYEKYPAMKQMLLDVDLYVTVPRKLLGNIATPVFSENAAAVDSMMDFIVTEKPMKFALFSSVPRIIDFSQFTVRGHYTQSEELKKYFQAMMWLGRTEMYLIAPVNSIPPQNDNDIQRQIIDAVLLAEAAQQSNAYPMVEEIDSIIRFFVGESDNVTLPNVQTLIQTTNIDSACALLDVKLYKIFQDTLRQKSFAFQRILSQIIISDPYSPDSIQPASAFLLLGQRFVIDSYVTGNVVYDKIKYNQEKIWRALPSRYDLLFSIGNNAAAQLLETELSTYHYASNLAALRYLIDSYDPEFWQSTLYNNWLNSIRTLVPPADRTALPSFMQTAAWWQEKMNTQLASWAQLRHDNLLYAKQSYTGGIICSFPESYVEPIPKFYEAVKTFAAVAAEKFQSFPWANSSTVYYWNHLKNVADTLQSVAQKELDHTPLDDKEKNFLKRMLYLNNVCGPVYNGWYYRLFYTGDEGFLKNDLVVADVHTCPTDESGSFVGWVLHTGTGPVNLAVVTTEAPDGRLISFIGPVMSYYEYVSTNFKRLTDEEWKSNYQILPAFRPDIVNLYLADSLGGSRGTGASLVTGIIKQPDDVKIPAQLVLGNNYPNPFNSSTIITFSIPRSLSNDRIELIIYDVQGRQVKQLINQQMPEGNYAVRWDGTMENGKISASGVYFYHLTVGTQRQIGKMSLIK
ncbi:MAG: DUF3160 domain-containing protein [Bacteroidota bacterium]|nr:DUF3160 domain-containing protein [Bacteroidota bacterium]